MGKGITCEPIETGSTRTVNLNGMECQNCLQGTTDGCGSHDSEVRRKLALLRFDAKGSSDIAKLAGPMNLSLHRFLMRPPQVRRDKGPRLLKCLSKLMATIYRGEK